MESCRYRIDMTDVIIHACSTIQSTKFVDVPVRVDRTGLTIQRPKCIVDYDKYMGAVVFFSFANDGSVERLSSV